MGSWKIVDQYLCLKPEIISAVECCSFLKKDITISLLNKLGFVGYASRMLSLYFCPHVIWKSLNYIIALNKERTKINSVILLLIILLLGIDMYSQLSL